MKINKEYKNNKQISVIYGKDDSININVFDNKILMEIAGSLDNNLKVLKSFDGMDWLPGDAKQDIENLMKIYH